MILSVPRPEMHTQSARTPPKPAHILRWEHTKLTPDALRTATFACAAFPRLSEVGAQLIAAANVACDLRVQLADCNWDDASSWSFLATFLEGVVDFEMQELDEIKE